MNSVVEMLILRGVSTRSRIQVDVDKPKCEHESISISTFRLIRRDERRLVCEPD